MQLEQLWYYNCMHVHELCIACCGPKFHYEISERKATIYESHCSPEVANVSTSSAMESESNDHLKHRGNSVREEGGGSRRYVQYKFSILHTQCPRLGTKTPHPLFLRIIDAGYNI